jgi:hypothetical protein
MNNTGTKSTTNSVLSMADAILKTVTEEFYGAAIIRTIMETPNIWETDVNILTQALGLVLHSYKIKLPKNIADGIRAFRPGPYSFEAANMTEGLKPRRVIMDLSPGKKILLIAGHAPVPGKDGFFTPTFKFDTTKRYHLDHLSFADIISLPEAAANQIIGKLFLPTQGIPGVTVSGQKIEAPSGAPHELLIGDGIKTKRILAEDGQECDELIAMDKGVILPTLSYLQDTHKIIGLDVKNRLEIEEIDCVTCDEKTTFNCPPTMVVNGAMRGKSHFVFGGSLEVRGVIEGPGVHVSNSITTAPLTLSIEIAGNLLTESIYNARIHANTSAVIMKDMLRVDLTAPQIHVNRTGSYWDSLMGFVAMSANQVFLERVNIRNIVELNIGRELFDEKTSLEEKREAISLIYTDNTEELQEKLATLYEKTENLKTAAESDPEARDATQAVYGVLSHILKKKCSTEQANQMVTAWMQNYGKRFFALGKGLLAILKIFAEQNEILADLHSIESQLVAIEQNLQQIQIKITGYLGIYGKIIIRCSGQEMQWENNTASEKENLIIDLKYRPNKGLVAR